MKSQITNLNHTKYVHKNSLKDKIINFLMIDGRRHTSEKNIKTFLVAFYKKSKKESSNAIKQSVKKCAITLGLKMIKRKKTVIKEIPFFVRKPLRISLAIKSIKKKILKGEKLPIGRKLLSEVFLILNNSSENLANKQLILNLALKKKMQAHFRWFQ
jgi:ribosomal protein S7